jgi:hypothetical protein
VILDGECAHATERDDGCSIDTGLGDCRRHPFVLTSGSLPTPDPSSSHDFKDSSLFVVLKLTMNVNTLLEKYGRFGLDATTAATTVSFATAKAATKMGVC